MIARTPFLTIASAVGVPAICLGLTLLDSGSALAQTSSGNSVSSWFNRSGTASGSQPVTAASVANNSPAANANNSSNSPLQKFKARVSSMGQSVKKTFSGGASNTNSATPKPKNDENPVLLSTPAKPRPDFYISLARIQERAGNATAAAEQYKRALELEPDNLAGLLALARLYDRQGQLAEAQKYYDRATVAHPKEGAAFNDQGLCFARQEKYPEAVVCLRKAAELRPDRALYRNNLATVQIEMGQIDAAFQTLAVVHGTAVAHYNIGFLLNRRGETAKALEQFKLAAASDAKFQAAAPWVESLTAKLASEQSKLASESANASPTATPQASGPVINPVVNSPAVKSDVATSDAALASVKPSLPAAKAAEPPAASPAETLVAIPAGASPTEPSAVANTAVAAARAPEAPTQASLPTPTPPAATPPLPSAVAAGSNVQNAASLPLANAPAALIASPPQTTLAVKEKPAASLKLSTTVSVKPSPSTPLPGPVQKSSTPPGPTAAQPLKPEPRRTQSAELVAQRPMRLPPTPEEIQSYSQGAVVVDAGNSIVPLPPVDPNHYPASRY